MTGKPIPIHCILMRRDGSQFAATMRLTFNGGAPKSQNSMSIEMDGAPPDLPKGSYSGAAGGIPLMEREVFELPVDGKGAAQRRQFVLDADFDFSDDGKPTGYSYRAAVVRLKEDFSTTVAVGYCYPAEMIEPLPRTVR